MIFLAAFGLLMIGSTAATLERQALLKTSSMVVMLAALAIARVCTRWTSVAQAKNEEEQSPLFEEEADPAVQGSGLYRDGVLPIVTS